ncbi:MAG: DUF5658 family protein [Acidobacteriota bacterium]
MNLARPVFLLFALNLVDALLTLVWVRSGIAPESNAFMATLLDMGDLPFLAFKIAMGLFTAGVLLYGSQFRLARYGVRIALAIYIGTFGIHVFTGLAGMGYL